MAWGSKLSATQLTSITSTEQIFSETPILNPYEIAHCEVDANFVATPTDDMEVNIYGSLDGTNWDDTPILSFVIDKGTDPNQASFEIKGVYQFRIGVKSTGATDTHTSADFSYRLNGVSAT